MTWEAQPPRRLLPAIVGLTIALIIPSLLVLAPFGKLPLGGNQSLAAIVNEAVIWTLTFAVLAIVLFWERRPLTSIGLGRPSWPAIRFGFFVVFGLIVLAGLAAGAVMMAGLEIPSGPAEMVLALPLPLKIFIGLSAGFTEEVLFRGYAIERMTELTRSRWLGAILPIVIFGAVHAPFWGAGHAIVAGMSGLWLTLVYLWRRNLWTNITAHMLLDGLTLIAADLAQQSGVTV